METNVPKQASNVDIDFFFEDTPEEKKSDSKKETLASRAMFKSTTAILRVACKLPNDAKLIDVITLCLREKIKANSEQVLPLLKLLNDEEKKQFAKDLA